MLGKLVSLLFLCGLIVVGQGRYQPDWSSLDQRPLPQWYDDAKIGIFIHWGVFSVPSFGSEWFWSMWATGNEAVVNFMKQNYRPNFTYADFAPQFTAEFYDPNSWADLLAASGARYVVLTSKHHEGYTMWPSKYSWNWNAMDIGPKRDLVGDLATAIRTRTDLQFGLYHSMFEWYHPLYLKDKAAGYRTKTFPSAKALPELYELVNTYRPSVIWSDGEWEASDAYWNSTDFIAWLYNDSPVKDIVVVNDRWGNNTRCKHGGFYNCDDKYNPGVLQKHKWENCMTVDRGSWGYRRNAQLSDFLSMEELLSSLAETISCGGNLLLNIGPTHDGMITPIFAERLQQMGQWLKVNGDAIYQSKPWLYQNDTATKGIWYTSKPGSIYAIVLSWPSGNMLHLGAITPSKDMKITMLGYDKPLSWTSLGMGVLVNFPQLTVDKLPCKYAWVLQIVNY